jgi:hypothetical protein
MTFQWYCSYQVWYKFSGGEIEVHREMGWLAEQFNHNGDPFSFQRNVVDPIGGAIIRWDHYGRYSNRWTPELYATFSAEWTERHNHNVAEHQRFKRQHPDIDWSWREDILRREETVPRPIYWSSDSKRFETEPWFCQQEVAA